MCQAFPDMEESYRGYVSDLPRPQATIKGDEYLANSSVHPKHRRRKDLIKEEELGPTRRTLPYKKNSALQEDLLHHTLEEFGNYVFITYRSWVTGKMQRLHQGIQTRESSQACWQGQEM